MAPARQEDVTIDFDEWHPPTQPKMPVGPQSFPPSGLNSLATLGARGAARILDGLLIGIPYYVVATIVLIAVAGGPSAASDAEMAEPSTLAWVALFGPLALLMVVYEAIAVTVWGRTVGKLVMGLRVARQVNGRCPLWWESGLRIGLVAVLMVVPHPLALCVAILLYTTAGFDPMRRNLVDRAAGTVVVCTR